MSNTAETVMDKLPYELALRVQSDPYFDDIVVVVADEGNIKAEIEKRQAAMAGKGGKWGVAVVVLQVIADDESPEMAIGPMKLYPAFQVVEQREQNLSATGTGKSARAVARKLVEIIKPCSLEGLTSDLVADNPCIEPVTFAKDQGANLVGKQVNFYCYEAVEETPEQVASPAITETPNDAPEFQITCATEGATIYYTTDGSYPADPARVPAATSQAYSGPIAIPAEGLVVRACAYKAGMIASREERQNVSVV